MACRSDNLKTADGWASTTTLEDDRDQMDIKDGNIERRLDLMMQLNELEFLSNLVVCTLPSGEVKQMTPEDCLAAGGTYGDLVACTLSDGSIQQTTPEDCLMARGTFGDNRDDLLYELDNLGGPVDLTDVGGVISGVPIDELTGEIGGVCLSGPECENLSYEECLNSPNCSWGSLSYEECLNSLDCSWDGNELIITSLKHPDRDITVGKATHQKGKRYGFYGSETGETPLTLPILPPLLEEEEMQPDTLEEDIPADISSEYPKVTTHGHTEIDGDIFTHSHIVDCNLPDGSVQQMVPEDCLAADGIYITEKHTHTVNELPYLPPTQRRGGRMKKGR